MKSRDKSGTKEVLKKKIWFGTEGAQEVNPAGRAVRPVTNGVWPRALSLAS